MRPRLALPAVAACLALAAGTSSPLADPPKRVAPPRPSPLDRVGANFVDALTGPRLLLHGSAIVTTYALSASGQDWHVRVNTARHAEVPAWGEASYWGGYALPIGLGPALWATGMATADRELAAAGAAATQAAWMAMAVTATLKWATGRPFPNHGMHPEDPARLDHPEYAREFNFLPADLSKGWAWPSGHASTSFAMAAALTAASPSRAWIPWVAYPVAAGISLGMINGQHHWTSDVVAGALIGQAIGWSVGRGFRGSGDETNREHAAPARVIVVPTGGSATGMSLLGWF